MDFLDIRKKAKERAQARAATRAPSQPDEAGPATERAPGQPDPLPSPAPRGEGGPGTREAGPERAAEEAGSACRRAEAEPEHRSSGGQEFRGPEAPRNEGPPVQIDARFTTWRPGVGERPLPLEPELVPPFEPDPADFSVVAPTALSFAAPGPAGTAPLPDPAPVPSPPVDPLDEFFYREDEEGPALLEIAAAHAPEAEPVILAREEFLTFLLGAEEYAVAIERVREVVRPPPITEVPRAPAHILGVVTVRGEVVAVVDPRCRLGLPLARPADGEGKVVIVDAGDGPCGLHVDRVASVVRLRPGSIEPCPQGIAGQRGEFLAGIGRDGERLFTVLDLGALLRRAPPRDARARRADAGR